NAWKTYSSGATNRNMYSTGSVMPVTNDVRATPRNRPMSFARRPLGTQWYIARHAPGRPNIIVAKRPARYFVPSVYRPEWSGPASCAKKMFCAPEIEVPATVSVPPNGVYQNIG